MIEHVLAVFGWTKIVGILENMDRWIVYHWVNQVRNCNLTASGAFEAEAAAARLQQDGLVDGVITTDGDAFLYGARQVCFSRSL